MFLHELPDAKELFLVVSEEKALADLMYAEEPVPAVEDVLKSAAPRIVVVPPTTSKRVTGLLVPIPTLPLASL